MIKRLSTTDQIDYPYSLIDTSILNKFYRQSLKSDNFNGVRSNINDVYSWDTY